jgi:hypothetical protein
MRPLLNTSNITCWLNYIVLLAFCFYLLLFPLALFFNFHFPPLFHFSGITFVFLVESSLSLCKASPTKLIYVKRTSYELAVWLYSDNDSAAFTAINNMFMIYSDWEFFPLEVFISFYSKESAIVLRGSSSCRSNIGGLQWNRIKYFSLSFFFLTFSVPMLF